MPHSQQAASNGSSTGSNSSAEDGNIVSDSQLSKTSSVLKSLARDWSAEGKPEREMAYGPLLKQLQQYVPLPKRESKKEPPRICVPGAGRWNIP